MTQVSYSYSRRVGNFPTELTSPQKGSQCLCLGFTSWVRASIWHLGGTLVCLVRTSNVFYTENRFLMSVESSVVRSHALKILIGYVRFE